MSEPEDLVENASKRSKNVQTVLAILKNEVDGDAASALEKMTADYSMTWMYRGKKDLFPTSGHDVQGELKEVYPIKGRQYEIKNIAEGKNVVMVELIESYPDPETGKVYRTPLVLVLEMQDGKIRTGRHYCDPRLSPEYLENSIVESAYQSSPTKQIIE
ncbi:MAG: hypothetical protein Q8P36_00940 [bacterium]|nr:hypothetical protein [bacterium]